MERLREATLEEVLAVAPTETVSRVRQNLPYGLWRFSFEDLGTIGCQLPIEHPDELLRGKVGTLAELEPGWAVWVEYDALALAKSEELLLNMFENKPMLRPILYHAPGLSTRHVLDGRHRLFAALTYGYDQRNELGSGWGVELYWSEVLR